MAVYTEKYPFEAPQLIKYCEIIRDLANRKPGTAWSMYDQQFRLIREDHLLPLDRIHYELWILADSPNTSNQSSLSNFRNHLVTNTTAGLFKVQCESLTTHVGHTTGKGTAETPHVPSNTSVATVKEHKVQSNVNPLSLNQENLHKHKVTLHPNSPIPESHQSKTIVGKAPYQPSNHKIKSVSDVSHTTKSATPIKLSWLRQFFTRLP